MKGRFFIFMVSPVSYNKSLNEDIGSSNSVFSKFRRCRCHAAAARCWGVEESCLVDGYTNIPRHDDIVEASDDSGRLGNKSAT